TERWPYPMFRDPARRKPSGGSYREPPVGFEPTTARYRIESSPTELRSRTHKLAARCAPRYCCVHSDPRCLGPSRGSAYIVHTPLATAPPMDCSKEIRRVPS